MKPIDIAPIRSRLQRRIAVKSVVLLFWAACTGAIALSGPAELDEGTYLYMTVAIVAVWLMSTVRDARRLRNDDYLERAAIAETDERNILITYRATRLAAVIVMCAAPVAICVLAFFDMQQAIDAIAGALALFAAVYLASWLWISHRS